MVSKPNVSKAQQFMIQSAIKGKSPEHVYEVIKTAADAATDGQLRAGAKAILDTMKARGLV
jgi:hypothetical protein